MIALYLFVGFIIAGIVYAAGVEHTNNTSLGSNTGNNPTDGADNDNNTFIGTNAGTSMTAGTGNDNTFVGYNAGCRNAHGRDNTFVGKSAGQNRKRWLQVCGLYQTYGRSGRSDKRTEK